MRDIPRVLGAFRSALRSLRHGATVVPLLIYFFLKLAIILFYASSHREPMNRLWALLVPKMDPQALMHYPGHLLNMPIILGRLDHLLEIVIYVLAQAMTILLFAAVARRERISVGASARAAGRRYPHLVLAAAIPSVLLFAAFRYLIPYLGHFFEMQRGLEATLGTLIGLIVEAFFLFTLPYILLEGRSAVAAIGASFRFAARRFLASLMLVFVPFILTVPTLLLNLNPRALAFQISPEFLIQAQIAGEIMAFVAAYLLMGAITMYFLETRAGEEKR